LIRSFFHPPPPLLPCLCVQIALVERVRSSFGGRAPAPSETSQTRDRSERGVRYVPRDVSPHDPSHIYISHRRFVVRWFVLRTLAALVYATTSLCHPPYPLSPHNRPNSCNPRFIITHLLFALHVRDRNANLKVLRRRRVFRLFMGSRRRRVCRRRAFEEECVISRLICRTVPNPSHIIHFMAVPLGLTTNYTVFLHLRRAHSQR
jgi:hypothetical protein